MNLTVRKVKTFRGMEGVGYNAELCADDKPVALVIDHGDGGCVVFEWRDHAGEKDKKAVLAWLATQSPVALGLAESEDEEKYGIKTCDLYKTPDDKLEDYVSVLVDACRMKRNHVVLRQDGKIYTVKIPKGRTREQMEALVRAKYPAAQVM